MERRRAGFDKAGIARVLLFVSGAVATAVVLASCSTFGSSDAPASSDATSELAVPGPDGGDGEAGTNEAGRDADADAGATWCSLHGGPAVAFCADFDRGASVLDTFDLLDPGASDAGTVESTSSTPESSPSALRTTVPATGPAARRALLRKAIHLPTLPKALTLEVSVRVQGCAWGIGSDAVATIGFNDNRSLSLVLGQLDGAFFMREKLTSGALVRAQDFATQTGLRTGWARFVVKVDYTPIPATLRVDLSSATPLVSLLAGWTVQEPLLTQDITLEIGQAPVDPWGTCQIDFDDVLITAE
jgi:hypothetical protein